MKANGIETRRAMLQTTALALLSGIAGGQTAATPKQSASQQSPQQNTLPELGPAVTPNQQERQVKAQNEERQKRLVADTEKLFQLATQLHDEVAKTNKMVLSVEVIKRAEEIEKLARGIKDRMRG